MKPIDVKRKEKRKYETVKNKLVDYLQLKWGTSWALMKEKCNKWLED